MKKVYKESVVLHEASDVGRNNDEDSAFEGEDPRELEELADDPRALLNRSWTKLFKVCMLNFTTWISPGNCCFSDAICTHYLYVFYIVAMKNLDIYR